MIYEPQPIETSHVTLSDEILSLTEKLAEHAHEVWARQRLADGWQFGPQRDDTNKSHPCLVPYGQLSEGEKQYDRNAALETLKVIQELGYDVVRSRDRKVPDQIPVAAEARDRVGGDDLLARLHAAVGTDTEINVLLSVWASRREDDAAWQSPELYRHIGQRLLKLGAAPRAKEVARAALEWSSKLTDGKSRATWAEDVELRQILGLALARTGNPDDAQKVLLGLRAEGHADEETLGMLARTFKDQAIQIPVGDITARQDRLRTALQHYQEAYDRSTGFWTGINVATLQRLLDLTEDSDSIARRVQAECGADLARKLDQGTPRSKLFYHFATLAEAALNLGDFKEAEQHYRAAYACAPKEYGNLNSARRHLRWLLQWWIRQGSLSTGSENYLDQWLPLPKVVVFAGHMLDQEGRASERFPPGLVEPVKQTLKHWLSEENALIGYSSGACGADLLFQEAIQELGGESHIVLPFDAEEFCQSSVAFAGPEWSSRFQKVIAWEGAQVVTASPQKMNAGRISYEYANLVLHGLAAVRAAELETNLTGLVVWDGRPGNGPGGTASVVRRWHDLGMTLDSIDLSTAAVAAAGAGRLSVNHNPQPPGADRVVPGQEVSTTRIMAMLFGDAVNFSKLSEEQVPRFVEHFLGPIATIISRYGEANVTRNTWGDGLYLVFTTVQDAGLCALDICDFVKQQVELKQWAALGLPEELSVRLALHAGPVFACQDPITGQLNYTGTHVSRAARLEPKTPPGEVYASQAFAALCSQKHISGFACDYVKQLEWAKTYGTFPTFVLRRRTK